MSASDAAPAGAPAESAEQAVVSSLASGRRVNLQAFKEHIGVVLRDKQKEYWKVLKMYTSFHMSKAELDVTTRTLFGDNNIKLHNLFISAILHNAQLGDRDPLPAPAPLSQAPSQPQPQPAGVPLASAPQPMETSAAKRVHAS